MMSEEIRRKPQKLKMGIIGNGFVGQATGYAFSTPMVDKMIVDPKYSDNTLDDLIAYQPQITFICLPTPSNDDGSIDAELVKDTVKHLIRESETFIVIKSTITPDVAAELCYLDSRIAIMPEFLSEGNAKMDAVNASHHLVGVTDQGASQYIEGLYAGYSLCNPCPTVVVSPVEASIIKYTINTFLAMKLTFFNQLYSIVDEFGGNYQTILRGVLADSRVGVSHTRIPGTDGKRGFGGACFPKDLDAFIHYADKFTEADIELLKTVKAVNNKIRSQYDTDDREKSNNIKFEDE